MIQNQITTNLITDQIKNVVQKTIEDDKTIASIGRMAYDLFQDGAYQSKDKLTNLFAEGGHSDYFVVFTNASGIDKHSLSKKNVKAITYGDLIELHESCSSPR
jgi:hypothetical protein